VLAVIVAALVDRDLFPAFPAEKSIAAIRAEVLWFMMFTESLLDLKQEAADLAFELRFLLAVVEVEIFVRSIAGRTDNQFWNHEGFTPTLDRGQRFAIFGLIGG